MKVQKALLLERLICTCFTKEEREQKCSLLMKVERNSDLRLLRDVTAAQNENTRVILNNDEFNKKIIRKRRS